MTFLFRSGRPKSQKPTSYSLIDLGRSSVKAAVVLKLPGNAEPQLIGYGQAETDSHDITGGRWEVDAVIEPANEALTRAEDSTEAVIGQKIVPDDVILALAGRATVGDLFTVKQSRPRPMAPISAAELTQLRVRAETLAQKKLLEAAEEEGQWQPLAVSDAGLRVDNHLVLDAVGLTGRELSYAVFAAAGQTGALRALETLSHRLDLNLANIITAPQAIASLSPHSEAIILDIGCSGTDICLINNNMLIGADWTPFGGQFFTQTLAQQLSIALPEAEVFKQALANNILVDNEVAFIDATLEEPRERWYNAVLEILAELSPDSPVPRRVYITGGGSRLIGLDRLFRTHPVPFDGAPEVVRLGERVTPPVKNLTQALDYDLFGLTLSLTVGLPL